MVQFGGGVGCYWNHIAIGLWSPGQGPCLLEMHGLDRGHGARYAPFVRR